MFRTRSQLTLPDFPHDIVGRSPLKEAKTARRSANNSEKLPAVSQHGSDLVGREGEDGAGAVARSNSKRPSPGALRERAVKRVKRLPDEEETTPLPVASGSALFLSAKPLSSSSLPSVAPELSSATPKGFTRSQSVPLEGSIPLVNLTQVPPSPWRSPSKSKHKLRIMSVPPMDPIPDGITLPETGSQGSRSGDGTEAMVGSQDEDVQMSSLPSPSHSSLITPLESGASALLLPAVQSTQSIPTSPLTPLPPTPQLFRNPAVSNGYNDVQAEIDPRTSRSKTPSTVSRIPRTCAPYMPLPVASTSSSLVTPKRGIVSRMKPKGSGGATPGSSKMPMAGSSALSADTRTPKLSALYSKFVTTPTATRAVPSTMAPKAVAHVDTAVPRARTPKPGPPQPPEGEIATTFDIPSIPVATASKLGGSDESKYDMQVPLNDVYDAATDDAPKPPALKPPALGAGAKPTAPTERRKKPVATVAEIPLGGRMTRSASLRQKENKKNFEEGGNIERNQSRPGVSTARSTTPGPSTSPSKATPSRRRAMSVSSFAQPTTSSSAKSNPPLPTRSRPPASTSAAMPYTSGGGGSRSSSAMSTSRPSSAMNIPRPSTSMSQDASQTTTDVFTSDGRTSKSSLSNLSLALQKLNMPAPSRPTSSVGFNRPNTSMGFNRETRDIMGDTDDEAEVAEKAVGTVAGKGRGTMDDSIIGTSSGSTNYSTKSKPTPLRRAATLGPSTISASSGAGDRIQSTLMLPPPVPKARPTSEVDHSKAPTSAGTKKINIHSGIVAGKPKGAFSFGNPKPRIFGVGGLGPAMPGKSRVMHRVSKQSSLPMVEGSPVKGGGGGGDVEMRDPGEMSETESESMSGTQPGSGTEKRNIADDANPFTTKPSRVLSEETILALASLDDDDTEDGNDTGPKSPDKWRHNASRRASTASQLLSQSLSSLPQTPSNQVPASEGKGKGRAVSSSYPVTANQMTAPGALGRAVGSGSHVSGNTRRASSRAASVHPEPETSKSETPNSGGSSSQSTSLQVLKQCTIFVDVRTDVGDDAGSLFVDMLKSMGAKILTRVGQSCTHIVYKNGLMSTLTRYRLLHEPRPSVVGIAWVVECVEQRKKVDETKFLVNLEGVNIAGSNKRRRSMLPKQLSNEVAEPRSLVSPVSLVQGEHGAADRSVEMGSPPSSDDPVGNSSFDNLPPLERARRRQKQPTLNALFNR